ncbi:unnamed protein product, partial [marine sediment metagenome]
MTGTRQTYWDLVDAELAKLPEEGPLARGEVEIW